ncbi:Putative Saponin hydrolase (Precursor) [Penicillium brasilianum]|uniref:Putative Saponin hydrolase (Precursor) n=1 Tax=Penicillium brasilianum TaxID=104259 RepID=A0A0F7TFZ7_PENBI|nr:Putative Saponin hydrolase (Precursor) [Penicillium brasilianum]
MRRAFSAIVGTLAVGMATTITAPPESEPIDVIELPLPPVAPSNMTGACTASINPHRTGCIGQTSEAFQAGDFAPDGKHVVVNVEFVGAPEAPDSASIYAGEHLILVKADGTKFSNGDPWKCLSCGVPSQNALSLDPERDYPHMARNSRQALWGHNILDCSGIPLVSDDCTPNKTHIYPIYWPTGTNTSGSPREMRLHPDGIHMGWSSFTNNGGQFAYYGKLQFRQNPTDGTLRVPRYDLVGINLLVQPNGTAAIMAQGAELKIHNEAITIGELRGFTGAGDEIMYIGSPREANNIDLFAVHIGTGAVRRLTSHPEYADPIAFSHDNQWFVTMDTRGSNRQMWMSGERYIPPLIDLVTVTAASSTRNNGVRRFFQPILIDRYGDRGDYFGQQVNYAGDGSNGSVNDPNWNGRADPAFSPDGTHITYWQALVTSPDCGGVNPLPCPVSTAQGGRNYRLMLARLSSRKPTSPAPIYAAPDDIPWATPFPAGSPLPTPYSLPAGNYTLYGKASGLAKASLTKDPLSGSFKTISVNYFNYSDDAQHLINGYESVTLTTTASNPWLSHLDWVSNIVQIGAVKAVKKTGPDGFHLTIDAVQNIFEANGTLTTTVNGVTYYQPLNGA